MATSAKRVLIVSPLGLPPFYVPQRRYKYALDEAKIARWLKEGRGLGERETYKPWYTVADVPSHGKVTRVCGEEKFGLRNMHFLSTNEWYAALHLWYDDACVGLVEQFPFRDRLQTLAVAARLGIKHPEDAIHKIPIVITTDIVAKFFIHGQTYKQAIAVKPIDAFGNERTQEKLRLEEEVNKLNGVPWDIWIDKELRGTYGDNLEWLHGYNRRLIITPEHTDLLLVSFLKYPNTPASKVCGECDRLSKSPAGTYLGILRALLATKRLSTDLNVTNLQGKSARVFFPMGTLATRATCLRRNIAIESSLTKLPLECHFPSGATSQTPYRALAYLRSKSHA
ncbi:TnsA endonuclease C-terminal domain-containing protein [Cupriavidus numazuensis]|uniref:Uncharacterized protein n=1 Tax=Cupriavidus numazuensis TaxID=221992 RepID=A0ABN7QAA9_9BURK|nr:TnsA endonuclease C-terminal domain-containing protein [Cupriavidus numazuensis]CAG2159213.1 hypothetical protein LMG26411_06526 [Cupriavidus numazuensis]